MNELYVFSHPSANYANGFYEQNSGRWGEGNRSCVFLAIVPERCLHHISPSECLEGNHNQQGWSWKGCSMSDNTIQDHWDEQMSQRFIDYGRYFIPQRERQMRIIVELLKDMPQPYTLLELCCGEGLLAEMILKEYHQVILLGLDGSQVMLARAQERLAGFAGRYKVNKFELADRSWRRLPQPVQAVVSMLSIHHLDGEGKQLLFKDVFGMLSCGGAFLIADLTDPVSQPGRAAAADEWDETVRQRSIELDGTTAGLDFFQREGWNTYRYHDPDDIDHPSPLFSQLKWLEQAGFEDVELHFFQAGHALFSGWRRR